MAWTGGERLCHLVARLAEVIRVDALWLSTTPLDMRAGTETILARVVSMFGEARPHHAYLFANRRANRMKVLVHDGYGIWLAKKNWRNSLQRQRRRKARPNASRCRRTCRVPTFTTSRNPRSALAAAR